MGLPMVKVVASAPGKVTLFGEHAVVYGYPAVVAAIGRRVYVTAEARDDDAVRIVASDLKVPGVTVTYTPEEIVIETDYGVALSAISYLNKAVELTSEYLRIKKGVNLEVKSEMPVGAGLGTSAAVSVATIAAYAWVVGKELSKDEIAKLGWEVEKAVQGIASPMDTAIATYGGFMKIKITGNNEFSKEQLRVESDLPIVIGYVEREASTKVLVEKVRRLLNKHPDLIKEIMDTIGKVTEEAVKALEKDDLMTLGELMNINHGLLDALGVSNRRLSELVYIARAAGALGAKLTGAGGGGCVIALAPGKQDAVEVAMRMFGSSTLKTELGSVGVTVRKIA